MSLLIGEQYEIVRELRRGAWVTVYEARHAILGRRTLIKWLNPAYQADQELVGRLKREARLGASVDHPNVARIHEVGEADGRPFVAIEWIEGEDLDKVQEAEGLFSVDRTLRLARDLLAGLSAIHAVGIVHRDLSPMNVRITPAGLARITDFGLATGPFDTHYTLPGSVVGTPGYLSPEQAAGKGADERSDLFSCGTLIHEALTGQPLFRNDDLITTLKRVRAHSAPALEESIEGLPTGFDGWLAKLLAKKADERFSSAHDALIALLALTGESLKEPEKSRTVVQRATGWGAVILAVVLVLLGVLILPGYLDQRAELESLSALPDSILSLTRTTAPLDTAIIPMEKEETLDPKGDRGSIPSGSEQKDAPLRTGSTASNPEPSASVEPDLSPRTVVPSPEPFVSADTTTQPQTGWLLVRTHPWAEVYIEALRVGATPGLEPLPHEAGTIRITLDNPGFPPIPVLATVVAAETTEVQVELVQHVVSLTVAASPWAKVYIDDSPVGETPITRTLYLAPGGHSIRFSHPEFGEISREVQGAAGELLTVSVDMKLEGTGFAPSEREEP